MYRCLLLLLSVVIYSVETAPSYAAEGNHLQQTEPTQQPNNARCGCLQVVLFQNPQFNCQCGEENPYQGTSATTTEQITSTTTPSTTTTTTTMQPVMESSTPPSTNGDKPGQCQCIMLGIFGALSAQYQCNCKATDQTYPTYPDNTVVAPSSNGIEEPDSPMTYLADTIEQSTVPSFVADEAESNPLYDTAEQYPLTTNCTMYAGVQPVMCICLPQYDQCSPNVCCLKSKFLSQKKLLTKALYHKVNSKPSAADVLMDILESIKRKLDD
ncbi:hypothetical protein DICVIV_08795 [Dictyocaulus viviparus]|uniref:Uncharacterized protein n=1 Tax=Dictyocaulus viviparus TaxID=29172 RepID=A0A0D8XKI6_DICVI|nr:hypothetical protein DICVIV_08795 [Dictyocaulus viviparus]